MKKSRLFFWVLVWLFTFVVFAAIGWLLYDHVQPLTEEECVVVMYPSVSTKEMGYWSIASLESDLRECGYSGREIGFWHAADFAKDSSVGYMPTDPTSSVIQKLHFFFVFDGMEDIPSLFTISEGIKCQRDQMISLDFVVEVESDGWKNGGPDEWNLKCVGVEE